MNDALSHFSSSNSTLESRRQHQRLYLTGSRSMTQSKSSFSRRRLVVLRVKALRRRVWFKALNTIERGLINSVVTVVDVVRSKLLAKVLQSIIKKLLTAFESKIVRLMRTVGLATAKKLSLIAQSWGNKSASKWITDKGFIQFITVKVVNKTCMFSMERV